MSLLWSRMITEVVLAFYVTVIYTYQSAFRERITSPYTLVDVLHMVIARFFWVL